MPGALIATAHRLHTIYNLHAEVDARAKTPSQQLEAKELIDLLLDNMNEEERKIAKLRLDGKDWRHIAQSLQGNDPLGGSGRKL